MPSRPASPSRVYVHTLGCPKNEADSRSLSRSLAASGAVLVPTPEQATHILLNTCGFIKEAKEESIGAILDACASYADKRVLVMGCLVERYRDELRGGIPEVSAWFGLAGGDDERALLRELGTEASHVGSLAREEAAETLDRSRAGYAYLKISDGCDEPCTFCAIPGIKGPYHSVDAAGIVEEARACLADGARELVLVGQDTTLWRDHDLDLFGLIDLLAQDERVRRLRVMYLQPERVTDAFLRHMARQPKLCRYLDVPFQHSHPDILRRMGRWGDGDAYLGLVERARRLMPEVAIRSSFIVGFPGETEEHFEHLLSFVRDVGFDYAGGFVYSPEEETAAAKLKPRVRQSIAQERLNRLNELLELSAESRHHALVGAHMEVMIDSLDAEEAGEGISAVGRTAGQAPDVDGVTYVEGGLPEGTMPGDVLTVTVDAVVGYDLMGTVNAP
ncbi:MAG: ribosomal protein S12 methylthiotransferase RimO [Actinobacteria bacterium RBG_16_64_13]|nr:MAG: ribosomal protein S12 methylthiotransferase RimO [Actinobacteria bacterium RBG_16_64_13]